MAESKRELGVEVEDLEALKEDITEYQEVVLGPHSSIRFCRQPQYDWFYRRNTIFIINCSFCYWYFTVAKELWFYYSFISWYPSLISAGCFIEKTTPLIFYYIFAKLLYGFRIKFHTLSSGGVFKGGNFFWDTVYHWLLFLSLVTCTYNASLLYNWVYVYIEYDSLELDSKMPSTQVEVHIRVWIKFWPQELQNRPDLVSGPMAWKMPEPDFSFVMFSLVYVSTSLWLLFRFLCCNLVVVRSGLLVPGSLLGRPGFAPVMWLIGLEDHLQNDLWCIEWDVKPY